MVKDGNFIWSLLNLLLKSQTCVTGTFAVVCLMTGKTVLEHSHPTYFETAIHMNASDEATTTAEKFYTPTEVATAVTFVVASFQVNHSIIFRFSPIFVSRSSSCTYFVWESSVHSFPKP